ncbi:MAG: NADH-quinone oxidoreductase subunit NuoK [Opitutales bacterium]|nr:NADH-quinone oxidoreductase subunit NuoK [Opitutales bacterium]
MTLTPVGLEHYLFVACLLFSIGVFGVLLRSNTLIILMCLELMLSASIVALIAFSRFNAIEGSLMMGGNLFVLFIIAIAAAEVAIGLAIIVALWRRQQTLDATEITSLKH